MKMDFRHRLACISGIILMITLASCDPYHETNCSLYIDNEAKYPVSFHLNFDAQKGGVCIEGEYTYTIYPETGYYFVKDKIIRKSGTPFQDIWKPYEGHQIYCRVYRLNPDTLEEEELLEEWKGGSGFFDESYWDLKMDHGMHGGAHGYDIYEWTFHYPPAREKMASNE